MGPLPYIYLTWEATTEDPLDFLRYQVWRRELGEEAWTKIALLTDQSITSYQDYAASAGVVYEYDVTVVISDTAGDELESDHTVGVQAELVLDYWYLHPVGRDQPYAEVPAVGVTVAPQQQLVLRRAFSRAAPTAHVGLAASRVLTLAWLDAWDEDGDDVWNALEALMRLQYSEGRTLMLRGPLGVRHFGALLAAPRSHSTGTVASTVTFQETHHVEAVE